MSFELDHVFVASTPGAPEMGLLIAAGFAEGPPSHHPGQGTASRRVFFAGIYLELIWVDDPAACRAPGVRGTRLAERADPRSEACPFGLGLRSAVDPVPDPPFPTWPYRPAYLTGDRALAVGRNSDNLGEPLLFVLPGAREAWWEVPRHGNGARRVTGVGLAGAPARPSKEMEALLDLGLVSLDEGPGPLLRIELDHGEQGGALDLRPALPVALRW